jgi:hypothetical protein
MSEKKEGEQKEKRNIRIAFDLPMGIMIGLALGILLLVIGAGAPSEGAYYAGVFFTAFALFAGAFLLKEENGYVRLGLFIAAGLVVSNIGPSLGGLLGGL